MAGGLGKRLLPQTNVIPKPLLPINGKSMIEHVIDTFASYNLENFYISINYKGNLIRTYLNELKKKESCKDLTGKIDELIERIENSLTIARENFYSPLMNGSWSIKSIINAVPDSGINYEEEGGLAGGTDAGLAWFICTDPKTTKDEIEKQKNLLIDYCAKDTLAVYYFIKFICEKIMVKKP